MYSKFYGALLGGAAMLCAQAASAQTVVVVGQRNGADQARAEAASRPGGVVVVGAEEYEDRYAVSFRDTLALIPGVIAQPRFGEEVRLSVRGSGLSNNAHLRGVELLFGGVPMNAAEGFGDFQELDPLFASHIVVTRGGNAFASGAATLGGAIELAPVSARDEGGAMLRVEAGSFETQRLHARAGWAGERGDALVAVTGQRQDGFRDQSEQSNGRVLAHGGWRWSPRAETRVLLLGADINQEIAGALTLDQALSNPRAANAGNVTRDYARDINAWRGAVRTSLTLGDDEHISFGAAYTDRHLHHPISIVMDQYVQDGLVFARWDGGAGALGYTLGARLRDGRLRQRTYANNAGARGALAGANVQRAESAEIYGEARWAARDDLTFLAGFNAVDASREYANDLAPSLDDEARFDHVSPKLGLLWRPNQAVALFANVSGSYEPPTFSQLTQGGLADFYPIAAQQGRTFEIGTRSDAGRLAWDISFYEARLEDEFVSYTPSAGDPAVTRNAPRTIHRGIEAGVEALLLEDIAGASLSVRAAWTHNDFRFDDDPVYRRNHLAAAPGDVARVELTLAGEGWRVAPNMAWQSDDTFVDYANTLRAPGHNLWGLSASWDASERITLFADARNLADERFVSTISAIADARAPGANLTAFTPGEGRAVFVGIRAKK